VLTPSSDHSAPGNPYAQSGGGGGYGQQAFGQQDQYSDGGGGGGDFWGDMNNVNALLQELKQKIEAVRQAHQSTLTSTDGSTIAYADQLSEDARQSREQCKNAIKRLAKAAKGNKSYKTQVDTVNKTFRDLLQDHQRVEQDYRKATKDRAVRQYKIVKPDATPQEIENVMSNDNPQVFAQALLNTNAYGAARGAYREVQERHTEILKIEKSMTELAQMMNEMSVLVEQQDEAIQVVQTNAENTHMDIDKG
jgi:syntaxin 1B/2/3